MCTNRYSILGGGMFGQNDNQQGDQNFLNQPDVPFGAPAPGSPAGPVSADGNAAGSPFDTPAPATPDPAQTPSDSPVSDELLSIKQEALQALTPLVSHLEQSPEEKFRTTMMMIQASDDQSLLRDAYTAAKDIADEKARAQALLDVINEINYFTQQHHS